MKKLLIIVFVIIPLMMALVLITKGRDHKSNFPHQQHQKKYLQMIPLKHQTAGALPLPWETEKLIFVIPEDTCALDTYDEARRFFAREYDQGCDGSIEACTSFFYQEKTRWMTSEYDDLCDGVIDLCLVLEFDEHGNRTRMHADLNCNQEVDEKELHSCRSFLYEDGNDLPHTEIQDLYCNSENLICLELTYDEQGRRTREWADTDCDGQKGGCTHFYYDEDAGEILEIVDFGCRGETFVCHIVKYDNNGWPIDFKIGS